MYQHLALISLVICEDKKEGKLLEFNKEITLAELKEAINEKFVNAPLKLYYKDNYNYYELSTDDTLKGILKKEKGYMIRIRVSSDPPKSSPIKRTKIDEGMKKGILINYFRKTKILL
jgi:hypothetical protein